MEWEQEEEEAFQKDSLSTEDPGRVGTRAVAWEGEGATHRSACPGACLCLLVGPPVELAWFPQERLSYFAELAGAVPPARATPVWAEQQWDTRGGKCGPGLAFFLAPPSRPRVPGRRLCSMAGSEARDCFGSMEGSAKAKGEGRLALDSRAI